MTLVDIDKIIVEGRYRQDLGDLTDLMESIEAVGLIHPIAVTPDMRLLAGQRRLEAVKKLGHEQIAVTIVRHLGDAADLLMAERDENTCRKEMTASELYALGKALEELERPKATERQAHGQTAPGRPMQRSTSSDAKRYETNPTARAVAEGLGTSTPTWQRLKHIGDRAESGDPEAAVTLDAIDRGEETIFGGYRKLREKPTPTPRATTEKRVQQIRQLADEGHRASQIAEKLGIGIERVRQLSRDHSIPLYDQQIGKTRRIDPNRIIGETITGLEGTRIALDLIDWEAAALDTDQVEYWVTSLNESLAALRKLARHLKEVTRVE